MRAIIWTSVFLLFSANVVSAQNPSSPAERAAPTTTEKKGAQQLFTFVRVMYNSNDARGGRRGRTSWSTDYPDAEQNLLARLSQEETLKGKINPAPIIVKLTDSRLSDYPFIYFSEPGGLSLTDDEAKTLRRYLDGGGFAMFDDFWGETEWESFYREIKKVYPDKEYQEIPLEHPIFHAIYDLKEKPQVPSIGVALSGRSYEREDAKEVHYRGFFNDNGRLAVLICHNTDLGDGWERAERSEVYFREYSEKKAYPMGVNIVAYVMTRPQPVDEK